MTSSFPGVMYGPLFYRQLEIEKSKALKVNYDNYDAKMTLSNTVKDDLKWWIDHVETSFNFISMENPVLIINTDASKTGWGAVFREVSTGGDWKVNEARNHINYLELLAVYFALKSFRKMLSGHIKVMIDNVTAVSCINHMGTSHSDNCNTLTRTIWEWCIKHSLHLTAAHIAGVKNTAADAESRKTRKETEWMLNEKWFKKGLTIIQFSPDIDLFASRVNKQLDHYISYNCDPDAWAVDAFTVCWKTLKFYAFPPFSVITRMLQKIQIEEATGIVVVPNWPSQLWFSKLMKLLIAEPLIIPAGKRTLYLPSIPREVHPLHKK